jgi:hypothetical protein
MGFTNYDVRRRSMKDVDGVIAIAMQYDIGPVMERYADETRLPPEALAEHEREIKRFLALSALSPGKYGMRGPLDELWHAFILFTSLYAEFCRQLGGGFIHHLPGEPKGREKQTSGEKTGYMRFLEDYQDVFREEPPAYLWPRPIGRPGVEDPSCDQCGQFCAQTCAAIELEPPTRRY